MYGCMDLAGKTILITGGTGSFGNAFVQHVLGEFPTATVRIFSRDELKQSEMLARFGDEQLRFFIGDIRNKTRLLRATQGADIVIHAAAMKQVPACEYNPFEAVQTNVLGAQHVVDCAIDAGVERVVALSTDKAVNPVNLYGATKLCAEKIFVQGNAYAAQSETRLACVRYGNVVGSRGSVVPVFKRLIAEGGPLTITDPRMTRFWISLDQAVDLVLFALAHMRGGEVFIPKIPSLKITDLADVIAPDLARETVGIRPGEKLHELLLTSDESRHAVELPAAYVVLPQHPFWDKGVDWIEGNAVADGFQYASDTNDTWVGPDEIATTISEMA